MYLGYFSFDFKNEPSISFFTYRAIFAVDENKVEQFITLFGFFDQ